MVEKFPIFASTQRTYGETVFSVLGKGKQHAWMVYSEWFKKGKVSSSDPWVEKQASALVEEIIQSTDFSLPEIADVKEDDGILKFLLRYQDGVESESVLIPMQAGNTLCISTQIGCKMGCVFCETGRMGLLRHLSAKEIIVQVFYARILLKHPVRNLVFMGMGEPLDNYEEVMKAVAVLTDSAGLGFGPSHITISTSGLVDAIYRLIDEADPALNLAVSVNASNDSLRNRIMPVNKKWNMAQLKEAMAAYCQHPRRQIFIEYVLLKGMNDTLEHAQELADYLQGLKVKVNVIPYNHQSNSRFSTPTLNELNEFVNYMRSRGYQTLVRNPKGIQIMAACGQLGNKQLRQKLRNHSLRII